MTIIFSETNNKNNFVGELCHIKWDHLFMQTEPNLAYDIFSDTVTALFNKHFPLRRKSRKSVKDNRWITKGLKKSSRIKTKLYKKWLASGRNDDKKKYRIMYMKRWLKRPRIYTISICSTQKKIVLRNCGTT